VAGHAVQDEDVVVPRAKALDVVVEDLHHQLVGNQVAGAHVLLHRLEKRVVLLQRAEDVPDGDVMKARQRAQDPALRALAAAGIPKQENRAQHEWADCLSRDKKRTKPEDLPERWEPCQGSHTLPRSGYARPSRAPPSRSDGNPDRVPIPSRVPATRGQ